MTFHALWSGYGVRKLSTVFTRWGFSTFSEELYGEDCVRWVNFGDTADVADIPRYYAGAVDKKRSEFVGSGGAGRGAGGAGGALDEGDIVLPVVKLVPGVWYHLAVRHGAASGAAGRGGGWLSVPKLFVRDQLTVMVDSAVRLERELPVPHLKRDKHRLERPAVGRGLNGQLASIYFFKEALPLALLHQLRDATSGLGAAFRSRSLSGRVGGASAAAAAAAQAAAASSAVGAGGRRSVPPDIDPLFDPGRQGLAERLLAVFNPNRVLVLARAPAASASAKSKATASPSRRSSGGSSAGGGGGGGGGGDGAAADGASAGGGCGGGECVALEVHGSYHARLVGMTFAWCFNADARDAVGSLGGVKCLFPLLSPFFTNTTPRPLRQVQRRRSARPVYCPPKPKRVRPPQRRRWRLGNVQAAAAAAAAAMTAAAAVAVPHPPPTASTATCPPAAAGLSPAGRSRRVSTMTTTTRTKALADEALGGGGLESPATATAAAAATGRGDSYDDVDHDGAALGGGASSGSAGGGAGALRARSSEPYAARWGAQARAGSGHRGRAARSRRRRPKRRPRGPRPKPKPRPPPRRRRPPRLQTAWPK